MFTAATQQACKNARLDVERVMFLKRIFANPVLTLLLAFGAMQSHAAEDPAACTVAAESCVASCKRFDDRDARQSACNHFCTKQSQRCASGVLPDVAIAVETPEPPIPPALTSKRAMLTARERNTEMLTAIGMGQLNAVRRLIETRGLHPTYVYAYNYNPQTRLYEGKAVRLRLADIFNDTNILRSDAIGLDRTLSLFIELGMDVKATLLTTPADDNDATAQVARTAWGPSLKIMEDAKDRESRLRAFELALQNGLVPNDDFSAWLFAELPQVCGRDKSQFAIRVFDLLIAHLGPTVQESLWRQGERGPETVSDVLDLSFAPPQAKYAYEKAQFAEQDKIWENCALLSRRINRFLVSGK
jgi:hypothetical protein